MMNPSMVSRDVGRAVDQDRIRRAEAARVGRPSRDGTGEPRTARRPILASVADLAARAFTSRSRARRRAATTG